MSNHFSAAMLKFPGDDARLDLTDLFLFASPETAGKTVVILDVNPFMTGADFHPEAVYRLNVDNDGDRRPTSRSRLSSPSRPAAPRPGPCITQREARLASPRPLARCSSRPCLSASTPWRSPSRRASVGCSSASAAIRSSPTAKARSMASSSPATTRSPARTSSPWRSRCPTRCSAPVRRSQSGQRSSVRRDGNAGPGRPVREPVVQPVLRRRAQERIQRRTPGR